MSVDYTSFIEEGGGGRGVEGRRERRGRREGGGRGGGRRERERRGKDGEEWRGGRGAERRERRERRGRRERRERRKREEGSPLPKASSPLSSKIGKNELTSVMCSFETCTFQLDSKMTLELILDSVNTKSCRHAPRPP